MIDRSVKRAAVTVLMAAAASHVALTAAENPNPVAATPAPAPAWSGSKWGVSKSVPPFDAFWAVKPSQEPGTALLWQFDSEVDVGQQALDETLDELDDIVALTRPGPGETLLPGATMMSDAKPELKGDAAAVPDGRFGGGIRLDGRGAVAGPAGFPGLVRDEGAATLDFWVHPDAGAAEAVLAALPGADGKSLLRVIRSAEGRVELRCGPDALVAHPRAAPAGRWTHVAVTLEAAGGGRLLVNGTEAAIAGAGAKTLAAAWPWLGGMLWLGAGCELESGLRGSLDSVRISRRERLFYELEDDTFLDPDAARPLAKGPPWFAKDLLALSCSFDGTLKPEQFAGAQVLGTAEPSDFREGVRGQALDLSRVGKTGMNYALKGMAALSLQTGTVEFWLKPLDWNNFFHGAYHGGDVPWMTLFHFANREGQGFGSLSIVQGRSHAAYAGNIPWVPIHPGRWLHVACVWGPGGARVYLNGKPQPLSQVSFQPKKPEGQEDGYQLLFSPSSTLIDEFRVYPYVLTPEEAWNAYARYRSDASEKMVEQPYVRIDFYQHWEKLTASLVCMSVNGQDPAFATIKVTAPDGKTVVLQDERVALDAALRGSVTTTVGVGLGFGRFQVEAESRSADGKVLKTVKTEYVREPPPWFNNTLGLDRVVPKPWTAIKADGTRLSVWGRDIRLGNGGLPESLISAGAEMLAAAPVLSATLASGVEQLAGAPVQLGVVEADRAAWTGTLESGSLRARVKGDLEYDGLMRFTVTLEPAKAGPVEVRGLTLDFPLREAVAGQLIANGGGSPFRQSYDVRMIPAGTGRVWDSRTSKPKMVKGVRVGHFCPVIWMGDDDRGLCFFGENDRGWTPDPEQPAQEIRREGGAVVYRMNVFTKTVRLDGPREFEFFIHPTPTKPLPPLWRTYNQGAPKMPVSNYEVVDGFTGWSLRESPNSGVKGPGVQPVSWEDAEAQHESIIAKFGTEQPVFIYIDYGEPVWDRGTVDRYVYWMNEYFKRGLIDGIYIDNTSLQRKLSLHGTAYKMDNGEIQPGWNTMGFRRFLQRMWVVMEQAGKPPRILPHMTWCFEIPALSFAEATVNGEDRDIFFPAEWRYMDVWGRDELRVMGSAEKWGFVTFWKAGFVTDVKIPGKERYKWPWMYRQSRTMYAHLTPHDFIPMWINEGGAVMQPSLAAFGLDDPDLRFIRGSQTEGMAGVTSAGAPPAAVKDSTLVCFYLKKDRALMMVSNYAKEDCEVTVTVNPRKLFGQDAALTFKDADLALVAPPFPTTVASKKDLKAAEEMMKSGDLMDVLDSKEPGGFDVDQLEEAKDPAVLEAERLAIHPDGNRVRMVIRKMDFRLIKVRRVGDTTKEAQE